MAHTNVPGSKYSKRYEDVEEILNAGIAVISTMNIQHLESLNDRVEQITGIRVRETVPDHVLHGADEIELIDISPQDLRQRMKEGNIYAMEKVEHFVCVNLREDSERLIRRGFRLAYRLKAVWYVTYVKEHDPLTEAEKQNLRKVISLTERLGGIFEMYEASDHRRVFRELVDEIDNKHATQVIVGQSARTRWDEIVRGSVVQQLLRRVRYMDVLIVADQTTDKTGQ